MTLLDWLPALTTTGLLTVALWLSRALISARLVKSVEFEFNTKIESIRAELRMSEERLKAQLREREVEISALRSSALSALANRHTELDKRRLKAVDELWASFNALAPARAIAASMNVVNFDEAARLTETDPKARKLFEMIGGDFEMKNLDLSGAASARPFLTPMVWAIFSAIQAVTMHGVIRWTVLKGGLGTKEYTDNKTIEKLIIEVLPHYAEYLEKHGSAVYYRSLEALDARLLSEIQVMLTGGETDRASVQQALEIIRLSGAVSSVAETVGASE